MAITNGYATLTHIKNRINPLGMTTQATDDTVIEEMVEQASRRIDALAGGRTFYARTETHYFDIPEDGQLDVDDDLLAITTLTNGDDTTIASTAYYLLNRNNLPYYAIKLRPSSGVEWLVDTNGESTQVIEIAGSWGYVDRAATTARDVRVIELTEQACIETVLNAYRRLSGENVTNTTLVTPGGVLVTPEDVPPSMRDVIAAMGRKY